MELRETSRVLDWNMIYYNETAKVRMNSVFFILFYKAVLVLLFFGFLFSEFW